MGVAQDAQAFIAAQPALAREIARQINAIQVDKLAPIRGGGLTVRQRDVLLLIREHISRHGTSPSYDEIKTALGLASRSGVSRIVDALEERGFIRRHPTRARSITLRST